MEGKKEDVTYDGVALDTATTSHASAGATAGLIGIGKETTRVGVGGGWGAAERFSIQV
jgi:hypothetical protein